MSENAAAHDAKQRDNRIPVLFTSPLLVALNNKSSKKNQRSATYILKVVVQDLHDTLLELNGAEKGKQIYDELMERYSKTSTQQDEEKAKNKEKERLKEQAKIEREERLLKAKEETLKLRKEKFQIEKTKQPTEDPATRRAREECEEEERFHNANFGTR